ncbi:MAG TPA: Clp protease N-terminal domain-containing protein [Acidimicrobiales bacterium]|nr:Clp protease N-terminal domain-containing protein [Acidimicrobiales bacterium]
MVAAKGVDLKAIVDRALTEWPATLSRLLSLATAIAKELNHTWVGPDHLLLALLHPECPGLAPDVLQSFGLTLEDAKSAFVESMGDPYDPHDRELALPPATGHVLSAAKAKAELLGADEPDSEHLLLALSDCWDRNPLPLMLGERGLGSAEVTERTMAFIEGNRSNGSSPMELGPWPTRTRPKNIELALSLAGHDPWRRREWGSVIFQDGEGRTFQCGKCILQYFIDRDGYPVLTTDGRPVHVLLDGAGEYIRDEKGTPMIGAVELPAGCDVHHWPR